MLCGTARREAIIISHRATESSVANSAMPRPISVTEGGISRAVSKVARINVTIGIVIGGLTHSPIRRITTTTGNEDGGAALLAAPVERVAAGSAVNATAISAIVKGSAAHGVLVRISAYVGTIFLTV